MALQRWLVTGGLGFIGSAFVRRALRHRADVAITVFDALTYAGNPANLAEVAGDSRCRVIKGDIADAGAVAAALEAGCDAVVNFAAETHVDRSMLDPTAFLRTNVVGVGVLLDGVRAARVPRFVHVSTDEVYGDIPSGASREDDPLRPRSPYAAAKAGGDLLVLAHHHTFGTPALITRGSNTYGPYQYPEKLIPLFITNLLDGEPVPVYGDGLQVRDWLHVDDHADGILHALDRGEPGHVYNLGGGNASTNMAITERLLELTGRDASHVRHVTDRPGHDRRYALDCAKAHATGWRPAVPFERGLEETVAWYRAHESWWRPIKSGEFRAYYEKQYAAR